MSEKIELKRRDGQPIRPVVDEEAGFSQETRDANARARAGRGVVFRRLARGILTRQLGNAHSAGEITDEQYRQALYALKKDHFVESVLDEAEKRRAEGTQDERTRPILDWIQENWVEILKVLLTLLPLLI